MSLRGLLARGGPPALFLLLSAGFLWQPLLTGQVLLPTDLSYRYDYLWKVDESHAPPGLTIAQNPLLSDIADYYYPYEDYAIRRLGAGQFPLWNPYILAGTPFFASVEAAVLDPINLLAYLAGPLAYWTWGAWLRLALLGLTTYGFLRALGRSVAAGLAAGVVFMCCGFVVAWLNYNVVTTLAWMPALFWATTRLLQTGRRAWLAATAAAMGLLLLAGQPEIQFLVGIIWGLYVLYGLAVVRPQGAGWRAAGRRLGQVAGATLLGLALAAVQLVTFVDFLLHSSAISTRAFGQPAGLGEMLLHLVVLAFPNFTGTPIENNYWVPITLTNFNEQTGYIGLLATALAGIGAVYWARRARWAPFFAGMALLGGLLAIRAPGFDLIRLLPVFNVGLGVRWLIAWSFCGATLAGYGLDALLALRPRTAGLRASTLWLAGAGAAALAALLILYVGVRNGHWDQTWPAQISHERLVRLFSPAHLTLYWPLAFLVAGAAVVLARWRGWVGAGAGAALLILLLYGDLWAFGSRYNPVTPPAAIYPPNQTTQYLTDHLGHDRLLGVQDTFRPDAAMIFGFRDLRGHENLIDMRFFQLYNPHLAAINTFQDGNLILSAADHRLLQVGGVRYLLTPRKPRVAGNPQAYRPLFQEGFTASYEDTLALPRAYVIYSATVALNDAAATAALLAPEHDPRRAVVLTGAGAPLHGPPLDVSAAPVTWQEDEPEAVTLAATLPAPGYLVLSDSDMPGWEATVDGQPAPLLRANVVYRAVALPAGQHTVAFYYRPILFYVSALVSASAGLVILGLMLASSIKGVRKARSLQVSEQGDPR